MLAHLGVTGLTVTLYLIGTGLSKTTLKQVGLRPLLQGVLLWALIGPCTLLLIRSGWIHSKWLLPLVPAQRSLRQVDAVLPTRANASVCARA